MANEYRDLLEILPLNHIEYAFAYGSAAITQHNEDKQTKMVDFILVSKDPAKFHHENLQKNFDHYSFLKYCGFGGQGINYVQICAARIYYNTLVCSKSRLIKYGIISIEDLVTDLEDWQWLYVAGRLHKPVLNVIEKGVNPQLKSAMQMNRESALHASLIQLPDSFTYKELFKQVVRLSYDGDFRMRYGSEDPHKIEKIVTGSIDELTKLYQPLLADTQKYKINISGDRIQQDVSSSSIYHNLNFMPSNVLNGLASIYRKTDPKQRDIEEVLFTIAHWHDVSDHLATSIRNIVRKSSCNQTFKNAITAGVWKSIVYASQKISKGLKYVR